MQKISICIQCIFLLLCGCKHSGHEKTIIPSFYYWQSDFHLSNAELKVIRSNDIQKLYIKFFDVSWNAEAAQPVPAASVNFSNTFPDYVQLIPVVFITNEALYNLQQDEIPVLATKMSKKISDILRQNNFKPPHEIQLDCDWTETTKEKYFLLIEKMKSDPLWPETIFSATIRLHQVKYAGKTGIPPVSRGVLMFYNMGDIENAGSANSIYDSSIAASYISTLKNYPLPLDAAIACFSWGLLFEHSELLKIIYPLYPQDMSDSLFELQNANVFVAKKSFYFKGSFIDAGNSIKLETMTPELSLESANVLASHIRNDTVSVILYHLDSTIVKTYTNEDLKNIFSAFQ